MTLPGRNIRLSMERIEGYRNFINKLWNASRFAMMNLGDYDGSRFSEILSGWKAEQARAELTLADRWILSRLQNATETVNQALTGFRFSDAANALYHFVWHEFCDWYIELAKPYLGRSRRRQKEAALLHPGRLGHRARAGPAPLAPADPVRHRGDLAKATQSRPAFRRRS